MYPKSDGKRNDMRHLRLISGGAPEGKGPAALPPEEELWGELQLLPNTRFTSIFTEAEALMSIRDSQRAVIALANSKGLDDYNEIMDLLFCELFPQFRGACLRFYNRRGPQLRKTLNLESLIPVFAIDPDSKKIKIILYQAMDIYLYHNDLTFIFKISMKFFKIPLLGK